jgi:hypothetical protein
MDKAPLRRRSQVLGAGYSEYELRRALRNGELTRLRRGAYLEGPEPEDVAARHRLAVRAAFTELGEGAIASHGSAAVLHGLPT